MTACCVCARLDWDDTRKYVYFWKDMGAEGISAQHLLFSDTMLNGRKSKDFPADVGTGGNDEHVGADLSYGDVSARAYAAWMFSPSEYARRWQFDCSSDRGGGSHVRYIIAYVICCIIRLLACV